MSRAQLIEMAKKDLAHGRAGTLDLVDEVFSVPAAHSYDPERWDAEMRLIFRRLPLLLATTAELRDVGDYKALEAAGVQVLITRTKDGTVRAFVNMCSHRGARLKPDGKGSAHRFTCPYHAWTFSPEGDWLLSASFDGTVRRWPLRREVAPDGEVLMREVTRPYSIAMTDPQRRWVAMVETTTPRIVLRPWETSSPARALPGERRCSGASGWTRAGRWAATRHEGRRD